MMIPFGIGRMIEHVADIAPLDSFFPLRFVQRDERGPERAVSFRYSAHPPPVSILPFRSPLLISPLSLHSKFPIPATLSLLPPSLGTSPPSQMERLNSEIYEKYKNLKKRKLLDEWSHKRDSDIRNFQSATEDLIEELKNENDRLRAEISSVKEHYAECEKFLLEESQKTKGLSNEVGRLQNLLSQKNEVNEIELLKSPNTIPTVQSRERSKTRKKNSPNSCTRESEMQHEEATIISSVSCQEEQIVADCCRRNLASSGDAAGKGRNDCVFQTLIEFLVGMKFSIDSQTKGLSFSVVHQMSGYNFSLTWIRNEDREGELMYHVSSLGTLERVALDWMKEDMVFSMTMCPIFFERISGIIGRH